MNKVVYFKDTQEFSVPAELTAGKRNLTNEEIEILKSHENTNTDCTWQNIYVSAKDGEFDPTLIHNSFFSGFAVLGRITKGSVQYHDLVLQIGITNSKLQNVVIGNDCAIENVFYMDNYRIGDRVMLFNVQELACTYHAKFGNGILKNGENESHRIWIGVANENDGRAVLAHEKMIAADAYLWSHYREDEELLTRFKEITEEGNSGKLDTYGTIDDDCVIKNTNIIKDARIGKCAYIKGAFKLKNFTMLSSPEEESQIGEGVILVNGILGYGSHVFYQAVAVRFVIGRNCQLKYGVRLLNSVLGDNSTVSCCEILNNLIYPFHEQHHNSSFLIATTIQGQSNIASGATIGSNHNSRSPDGEIFAKRGFWPGLCSDFKHNSRFASFDLISKGSYQYELDIPYPFALVAPSNLESNEISIIPAWWFMYDMFAIARNKYKFSKRDKRVTKIQHIETDPLAPDTMQEIMSAIDRLIGLTAQVLPDLDPERAKNANTPAELYQAAKDYMHHNEQNDYQLHDDKCQKKYGAVICKPVGAYKMYRKIVKYFATRTILEYFQSIHIKSFSLDVLKTIRQIPLYTEWENVGGQIIPSERVQELFTKIKNREINTWDEVHEFYDDCQKNYNLYKLRYSVYLLEQLYSRKLENFTLYLYDNIVSDVTIISNEIYNAAIESREKDYTDYYRQMVYSSLTEMEKVIGTIKDNDFLNDLKIQTEEFNKNLNMMFDGLTRDLK